MKLKPKSWSPEYFHYIGGHYQARADLAATFNVPATVVQDLRMAGTQLRMAADRIRVLQQQIRKRRRK